MDKNRQYMANQETFLIQKTIGANSEDTIEFDCKQDGTIEGVEITFYAGQERALQVRPMLFLNNKVAIDLITYVTENKYASGEDETREFKCSYPIDNNDKVKVYVKNTDSTYDYTLNMSIHVDYFGGKARVR